MENLESKIIAIIQNQPGIKGRLIASKLGVDKTQINSLLYGKLKSKVVQNKNSRMEKTEKRLEYRVKSCF